MTFFFVFTGSTSGNTIGSDNTSVSFVFKIASHGSQRVPGTKSFLQLRQFIYSSLLAYVYQWPFLLGLWFLRMNFYEVQSSVPYYLGVPNLLTVLLAPYAFSIPRRIASLAALGSRLEFNSTERLRLFKAEFGFASLSTTLRP